MYHRRPKCIVAALLAIWMIGAWSAAASDSKGTMPRLDQPIDLSFPQPTPILEIYRAVARAAGIEIIFDPRLRDQTIVIDLQEISLEKALQVLGLSAGHFYKVLDARTILIAADTPDNRRQYEDLVLRTFYLENVDSKTLLTGLRSLLDVKRLALDQDLNAITLRDTADKVRIAERLVLASDKVKPEVELDVELLQFEAGRLDQLAARLGPAGRGAAGGAGIPLRLTAKQLARVKGEGGARTLAHPTLSVVGGERGRLLMGEVVPIPVASRPAPEGQEAGGSSFQYQDVGFDLRVRPQVHAAADEITLDLEFGFTGVSDLLPGPGGGAQPVLGKREVRSSVRLGNGETYFLTGLIRTGEASDPGSAGPVLPLFGGTLGAEPTGPARHDLALAVTPRIVRRPEVTAADTALLPVGSEARLTLQGEEE